MGETTTDYLEAFRYETKEVKTAYKDLKRAYKKATDENMGSFNAPDSFGGSAGEAILTKFAQYWLEAIDNERKARGLPLFDASKGKYGQWVKA